MSDLKNNIFLLLGGNVGNVSETFLLAKSKIEAAAGKIIQESSIYKTSAWGKTDQPDFLNQVLEIESALSPYELLEALQQIEIACGRERKEHWGARTLDIDILFYHQEIIQTQRLYIPHPQLHLRRFTLIPFAEIAADFYHPVLQKVITSLLAECPDKLEVQKI